MYRDYRPGKRLLYGYVTLQVLRENGAKAYLPTLSDIPVVVNYLGEKGLPPELALTIFEFAEYVQYLMGGWILRMTLFIPARGWG
jgi:hypothetical protein